MDHSRCVIYIETDLLSATFEGNGKPSAVLWEQDIVACNQLAKNHGVAEGLSLQAAMETCPGLVLLTIDQADMCSNIAEEVFSTLKEFSTLIQRTSLDQYFIDVSELPLITESADNVMEEECYGCNCGCAFRLRNAKFLANKIEQKLHLKNISCRTGVSFNKTLARLAAMTASRVAYPSDVHSLLQTFDLRYVPHLPFADLVKLQIKTFQDLQHTSGTSLKENFGDLGTRLKRLGLGEDGSPVLCEDTWRTFPFEAKIRDKFRILLLRLLSTLEEDHRTPGAIKVYLRKYDPVKNINVKEAKISTLPARLHVRISNDFLSRLLSIIMSLFRRLVNLSRPCHITLLGLAFVRLQDHLSSTRSVASCLLRKREQASVQVIVDLSHPGWEIVGLPTTNEPLEKKKDGLENDASPCQKKAKLDIVITKAKFRAKRELASPSKLRVADLNLNGTEETNGLIMNV